jgi:acetyl esterase/lipase
VTSRRLAFIAAAFAALAALAVSGAAVFAACGSESSERSDRRRGPTTTTRTTPATVTTVGPQTVPVPPLPPAGPTTVPPPAITVPRGTAGTAPPASTTAPTVTAAPASTTPPTVTNAPASTTTTSTTTTSTTKPGKATRRTVVYSPPGAPKRQGDLVLPRQHSDTIVVLVHGEGTRKQMRGWADFYARNGYPTLAIDYLVEKPSTPSPVYPKPQTDVKAAVQNLRERAGSLGVNPDRIVVQGFSTGAALGAQADVTPNDAFFDGPARYPNVSDAPAAFVGFYGRYDGGGQKDPTKYYGGPPDSSEPQVQERYAKADSIAQAAAAAGPALLFTVGSVDNPDPAGQSGVFSEALQTAGKDVTLTSVPGAGPSFDQEKSGTLTPAGQQAAQQVLDWLRARFPGS